MDIITLIELHYLNLEVKASREGKLFTTDIEQYVVNITKELFDYFQIDQWSKDQNPG